jgi:8-oxo-dGTP diphosphatase
MDPNHSVTIILENPRGEFLLQLRDDKPEIPFPNRWVLPGGRANQAKPRPKPLPGR